MNTHRCDTRGQIDRSKPVTFKFDGKDYQGYAGDTLASALLANGVHLVGRSFKYHRPRGVVTAGSDEPNALVEVHEGAGRFTPNTRMTLQEIYPGLTVTSQNRWPSLSFDGMAINDRLYMMFSAGFYYKTFMWPQSFWKKVYEPVIRQAAGLGKPPTENDSDNYTASYLHCDVLVVGTGAAGLAAALEAGRSGARTVVVDEHAMAGGSLLAGETTTIDGKSTADWACDTVAELEGMENVSLMTRTTAFGYYHENFVALVERLSDHLPPEAKPKFREKMWRVRAKEVVLAQGALERPLVFDGNDRPGVMLASAAQTFLHRYGVKVCHAPAVATSHDSAWRVAFSHHDAGMKPVAIIDTRAEVRTDLLDEAKRRGIPVRLSHTVVSTKGRLRVKSLHIAPVSGGKVGAVERLSCDAVLMCGSWTPSLHLFSHTKGNLAWSDELESFLPGEKSEKCHIAGAGDGLWGFDAVLQSGADAGAAAASGAGFPMTATSYAVEHDDAGTGVTHRELPTSGNPGKARAFTDFQNDVTAKDVRLAVREGMRSIEHVKRYTTNGMATDQGKLSNMNGLVVAADALAKEPPKVGLTTFRPPYSPTTFGTFTNLARDEHFLVTRRTAIDNWAEEQGAVFEPVSLWRRAWYFPQPGESMHDAVNRECLAMRKSVGIFDASTLGKIDVKGPDAVEFMNRMYTNPWAKLGVGRCRYGLLLGEDGYIRDDGIIGRLAEDHFHVTTTSGGAPMVMNMMEDYLQTEWPDLKVWLTSITEQYSVIALHGPNARKVLEPFVEGLDISEEAFPHMSVADCTICGLRARLFRVSFTGEFGFEINIPSSHGREVWETLMEAGKTYGIVPYGTEALHVLRADKGYIGVGQDTDGTVTPYDAGLGWAVGKKKPDFVGMRSLARPDLAAEGRKQLVGLLTKDPKTVLEEGAQIVDDHNQPVPMKMTGHVTSSYWSPTVGRSIAMALIENGHARLGEVVHIPMPDQVIEAEITGAVFFDPDNTRLSA